MLPNQNPLFQDVANFVGIKIFFFASRVYWNEISNIPAPQTRRQDACISKTVPSQKLRFAATFVTMNSLRDITLSILGTRIDSFDHQSVYKRGQAASASQDKISNFHYHG